MKHNANLDVANDLVVKGRVLASVGSTASPSISFTGNPNSGLSSDDGLNVQLIANGTEMIELQPNANIVNFADTISVLNGNATTPSLRFAGSSNTGVFLGSGERFGITAQGKEVVTFGKFGSRFNDEVIAEAFYVQGVESMEWSAERFVAPRGDTNNPGIQFESSVEGNVVGIHYTGSSINFRQTIGDLVQLSTATFQTNVPINIISGSATSPGIRFAADGSSDQSGLFRPAGGQLSISANEHEITRFSKDSVKVFGKVQAAGFYLSPGFYDIGRSLNFDNIPFHINVGNVDNYVLDNFVPQRYLIREITVRCEKGEGIGSFYIVPKGDGFFGREIRATRNFYIGPVDRTLDLCQTVNAGESVLFSIFQKDTAQAFTHVRGSLRLDLSA